MLDSFRNFTKSLLGKIVVFLILGIIAIAFAASDVTGIATGGAGKGNVVAKVGDHEITEADLADRVERFLRARRGEGQPITMEQFLQGGGLEMALDELIDVAALQQFAQDSGMSVGKQLIDGEIANDPRFQGIDGKFDQSLFDRALADNRVTNKTYRADITRDRYIRWLLGTPSAAGYLPEGVAAPYASLPLERRQGVTTQIRTIDMDPGPDPDDKTLTAYYTRNKNRYMVPERRVLRYTIVKADHFEAQSAATEAEIADAFAKSGPRYAATEKRTLSQIVLIDEATARAVAAEVNGGKSIADAAKTRGLEPRSFDAVEKAALARETSPQAADAAFGIASAGVAGPVRTPLGWVVMRVDTIQKIPAKTLDQAREELAGEIAQRKTINALVTLRQSVEDGIGDGLTFDELMQKVKLTGQRTAPVIADGSDPDNKDAKPTPEIAAVAQGGFLADPESQEPQLAPIDKEGGFAVLIIERVVPAAPRPLAAIRADVNRDYLIDEGLKKARKAAQDVVNLLNKGVPLTEALRQVGVRALPPINFDVRRGEIGPDAEPKVRMAFSMAPKTGKLLEAPQRSGYFIVYVAAVEQQEARGNPAEIAKARAAIGPRLRQEQAAQFVESIKRHVKVTRNAAALAAVRAQLARQGAR